MKQGLLQAIPLEWKHTARMFMALGDEQRQRILLTFEPNEKLNITQIVAASTLSRSAIVHHLRILHESGAMQLQKNGKEVLYWVDYDAILLALRAVDRHIMKNNFATFSYSESSAC